jgi:hypothetical protein
MSLLDTSKKVSVIHRCTHILEFFSFHSVYPFSHTALLLLFLAYFFLFFFSCQLFSIIIITDGSHGLLLLTDGSDLFYSYFSYSSG